jgi:hypothetical protein
MYSRSAASITWMNAGKLDFVVVGARRRILQSHLDAFIQEATRAAKEEMAEKRDARISANNGGLVRASLLVEMGGVEPPSRKVSRRFTTSLVRCLMSLAVTQRTRQPLSRPANLNPA